MWWRSRCRADDTTGFGSDQMRWPEKIGEGIEAIEQAPFLTEEQKRDILYYNAVRFLRLERESGWQR